MRDYKLLVFENDKLMMFENNKYSDNRQMIFKPQLIAAIK